MIEVLLLLSIIINPVDAPAVTIGEYDPDLFAERDTSYPDCTPRSCNNDIGRGCQSFSSWLLPAPVKIQVGCGSFDFGQINNMYYCTCHCRTGGSLTTPCTTQRMAAPETKFTDILHRR